MVRNLHLSTQIIVYLEMKKTRLTGFLNVLVLLGSLAIVANLSYDILTIGVYNPESPVMLNIQLWVCAIFLVDFWVRFAVSAEKLRFFGRNILLLIFSIPYLNLVGHYNIELKPEIHYLLGLVPLLRGGYGLLIIIRWIAGRSVTTLVFAYLSMLVSVTYFSSLLFYVAERGLNPELHTYADALWWACMDMDTVGSNIIAVTPIGRVLSVILACSGMMMLPIFTVYITDRVVRSHAKDSNPKTDTTSTDSTTTQQKSIT